MKSDLERLLAPFGQGHLLTHWDGLGHTAQTQLAQQIRSIDFQLMKSLVDGSDADIDWHSIARQAEAPPAIRLNGPNNRWSPSAATDAGREVMQAGKAGVLLVAGGQGSRLGFDKPKSLFPIGPLSRRTLLQMHVEQTRAVATKYDATVPLYLMTSPATHEDTVAAMGQHVNFGLPERDLTVFCQGSMPAVDAATGKLLLASKSELFLSPDGHGGTLAALSKNGCLDDMAERGIEYLYYFQVDNPLAEICQTDLIGYHVLANSEMTTQVIRKRDPLEKVGNVISRDGTMMVIEYSDLPDEEATRTDADGQPIFWAGSIAIHVFNVDFLRRVASTADTLPFHRAHKKVPWIDESGTLNSPEQPNAIKYERFIFDLMPHARNPLVVEGQESQVFAPLKNANGAPKDTPDTVRAAITEKHKGMLREAGASVSDEVKVEVNPLFALDAEQLAERIEPGLEIHDDLYLSP